MKKWLKRLFAAGIIFGSTLLLLLLGGSGVARRIAARAAARDFPAPGRVVEVAGRQAHIHCTGSGSPTIILESGLDTSGSWGWEGVREGLSRISRVCAYDRAGILWSEPGGATGDALGIADELHELLAAAEEAPPYVLVGHSLGGVFIRVFDQRYPGEAVGFVFVDSSHPEQEESYPDEVRRLSSIQSFLSQRWIGGVLAPYISLLTGGSPSSAYLWRSVGGVGRETAAMAASFAQVSDTGLLGDRPVVVLSSGNSPWMPLVSEDARTAMHRAIIRLHEDLAALSSNSNHWVVEGAGHYIHWDRPDAVVAAVRDVVDAAREEAQISR